MNNNSSTSSSHEEFHEVDWKAYHRTFDENARRLVVSAVNCNDVKSLKLLFKKYSVNSSSGYYGYTPLHQAVLLQQRESFDFLITVEDIDLDRYNWFGETPLTIACEYNNIYFANELIRRGADVNQCTFDGMSPLSYVIESSQFKSGKTSNISFFLSEIGVRYLKSNTLSDINFQPLDKFPLLQTFLRNPVYDLVHMLLYYGAIVSMVDHHLLFNFMAEAPLEFQETLLLHCLDAIDEVDLDFITMITTRKNEVFSMVLGRTTQEYCDSANLNWDIYVDQLVAFLKKFPTYREYFFETLDMTEIVCSMPMHLKRFIKFIFKLAEESLLSDYLETERGFIMKLTEVCKVLNSCRIELTEFILLLISYGLPVYLEDFLQVHSYFGNGFLVKLFLDIIINDPPDYRKVRRWLNQAELMGVILYKPNFDFNCDIADFPPKFMNGLRFEFLNPISAFRYFASIKFRKFVSEEYSYNQDVVALLRRPHFPSLIELSRNVSQKYIYYTWGISDQNPGKYYDIVKRLPIHNYCKQILTFDVELYSI